MSDNNRKSNYNKQGTNSLRSYSNNRTNKGHNNQNKRGSHTPFYQRKSDIDHATKEEDNALYLVNNPSNLYDWKEKFITYATVKYGDAGVALRSGEIPYYMEFMENA